MDPKPQGRPRPIGPIVRVPVGSQLCETGSSRERACIGANRYAAAAKYSFTEPVQSPTISKNMPQIAISLVAVVAVFFVAGCGTTENNAPPPAPTRSAATTSVNREGGNLAENLAGIAERPPIDMGQAGSKSVSFERVILTMEAGAPMGKVTGGLLNIAHRSLRANPGEASKACVQVGREELRKAHYTTLDESDTLFGDHQIEKYRYQLGANITWMHLDIHVQPRWSTVTVTSRGNVAVTWQVFDTRADKIVFTLKTLTPFQDVAKEDSGSNPELAMFRKAVRDLLAQKEFAAFMSPDTPEPAGASGNLPAVKITPAADGSAVLLPDDFGVILDAFITLEPGRVIGSAFLISPDGYALTAAHVVSGLKTVPARLHSGIVLDAEVIRINDEADVALIKLPGSSFKALSLRAAGEPPIGSDVFVVGNPRLKELDASVSKGVVSGNRSIGGHKYLQTDAAANPGSSGGPVLDRKGNVLGIISWKFAGAEVQGLAFAVPLADAMSSLNINLAPTP